MSKFKYETVQEYYNALVEASATGRFPAIDSISISCRYRAENGKACAFGIGIPDESYNPDMEGSLCYLTHRYPDLLPKWATLDQLLKVQEIHDNLSGLEKWDHKVFLKFINHLDLFKWNCVINYGLPNS